MAFDYKKEYKEFYLPPKKPSIVTVPAMNYIAVRGKGNPNDENGEYKSGVGLLYGIAFTIKMSNKGNHKMEGYFQYVVPPLEGFWWQDGIAGMDYNQKEKFNFISVIRLPDFVTKEEFDWAVAEATAKKKTDFSKVEFLTYEEGECVQCMHIGSFDEEPQTVAAMHEYARQEGYELDITESRYHHEIYLSDPRRCEMSKLKTVVRHPIRKRIRKRKNHSPVVNSLKMINLAASLVAILSLQTAMFSSFSEEGEVKFQMLMNTLTGTFVCLCLVTLGIASIRKANRELKQLKIE